MAFTSRRRGRRDNESASSDAKQQQDQQQQDQQRQDQQRQDHDQQQQQHQQQKNQTDQEKGRDKPQDADKTRAEAAQAWLVIAAATATLFIGVGYTNAFGIFQEYYESTLFPDEPHEKLLLIGSIASSLYMVLGAFAGRFADLVGYQISLGIGSALMIGSMFAASASREFYQFFLSQGLMFGIGLAFVYAPAVAISRQYFGAERHGMVNGIVVSGGALGGCVLPYSVRAGLEQQGLAGTFRILGYLAAVVLVPSMFLLKPKQAKKPTGAKRGPLLDFALLRNAQFVWVTAGATIAMIGFLPRYFLLTPSAVHQGIGGTYAAWLLGLMNGLSILGRVGIGLFADRYGQVTALEVSFICCGLGHIVFWVPSLAVPGDGGPTVIALFTLFSVYIGIFGSGFISLFAVVVAHLFGADNLASKVGLLNTFVGLGTFVGPSMIQAIVDNGAGHWISGIVVSGVLMIAGGVVILVAFRRFKKHDESQKAVTDAASDDSEKEPS